MIDKNELVYCGSTGYSRKQGIRISASPWGGTKGVTVQGPHTWYHEKKIIIGEGEGAKS